MPDTMNHIRIEFGFGLEKDRDGATISRDAAMQALARIRREAITVFGAYTLLPTNGGWVNSSMVAVEEAGMTLFTVQPVSADKLAEKSELFAQFIKLSLNQEAVALTTHLVNFALI